MVIGAVLMSACNGAPQTPMTPETALPTATVAPATETETETPAPPTPTAEPLAALVNGEPLTLAEYERQLARYEAAMAAAGQDPSTPEGQAELAQARGELLEQLIEQMLIIQAAHEAGIEVTDAEVDAAIQSLVQDIGQATFDQRLANEGLTLETARLEMWRGMMATAMVSQIVADVPTRAEHIRARHILVSTEESAAQLRQQLQGGANFATLAQTYSQDTFTRDRGGDLGFFPRGILISPEVEAAAFALQPEEISEVVQSELGYHILQVVERIPDMEIAPNNLDLLRKQALQIWLDTLKSQAEIQRFVDIP